MISINPVYPSAHIDIRSQIWRISANSVRVKCLLRPTAHVKYDNGDQTTINIGRNYRWGTTKARRIPHLNLKDAVLDIGGSR